MSIALAAVAGCEVLKEESGMAGKLNSNSLVEFLEPLILGGRKSHPKRERVSLASFLLRWGNNFFKVFSK